MYALGIILVVLWGMLNVLATWAYADVIWECKTGLGGKLGKLWAKNLPKEFRDHLKNTFIPPHW